MSGALFIRGGTLGQMILAAQRANDVIATCANWRDLYPAKPDLQSLNQLTDNASERFHNVGDTE